jgi:ribokinase
VAAAAAIGKRRGLTVILDPAPACALPATLVECVDILTPNEREALILLGRREAAMSLEQAPDVAAALRDLGVSTTIMKLTKQDAFMYSTETHTN